MSDTDIVNLADNNTPYVSAENAKSLVKPLESTACRIFKWFSDNQPKGNTKNVMFFKALSRKLLQTSIQLKIEKRHSEKLLEAIIDNTLSFEEHIKTLCGKARSKHSECTV